jgi:hypothetical protein
MEKAQARLVCKHWQDSIDDLCGLVARQWWDFHTDHQIGDISSLVELQWLMKTFVLTRKDVQVVGVFTTACETGCLPTAKWLAETFDITRSEALTDHNLAFRLACTGGHLNVAIWLVCHFSMTSCEIEWNQHRALQNACEDGHIYIVQWLISQLNRPTPAGIIGWAFHCACNHGQLATAQWFAGEFKPEIIMPKYGNFVLGHTCVNGHLSTAQWLAKTFSITEKEVKKDDNFIFRNVCANGRLLVAVWLAAAFNITAKNSADAMNRAWQEARRQGYVDVEDWLMDMLERA